MGKTVKDMMAAANEAVPRITPQEMLALMAQEDALLLDVRDPHEVAATGKIKGAKNISRGMLEFRADPATPYHDPDIRRDRALVLYCASGGRSALACKTLQEMGYERVHNLGGFKDATEAGLDTEPHQP
ncbi:rhodanese-like domain-containing protein [Phenylobacterium sp.]|uniref:rhodanese-like domain-containing protein n=1 Tax=Phenylobacterium sp. TaxID=1871053 RepID=UPI0012155DC6|nr:rhodanese-like domain-containing protein [Phenylobacterium sp.]TAL33547.1 MAG: rhodanese-like domain-containing protein [Phenylobacterium sp.]